MGKRGPLRPCLDMPVFRRFATSDFCDLSIICILECFNAAFYVDRVFHPLMHFAAHQQLNASMPHFGSFLNLIHLVPIIFLI